VSEQTFKPGDRVRHADGSEGWVVELPRTWDRRENSMCVVIDGSYLIQQIRCDNFTLISDRYEPVDIRCWFGAEQHYRLVPPPCQHKYVCKCGEEKPDGT
jgi:hypothetical protein